MRGPDLTEIMDRTRADWLRRWLYDPQRISPGTSMPTFFSGVPWPEANHKITQLVYALSAGKNMPIPAGLNDNDRMYLLSVGEEPLVQRCFLTEASPRSICVGLPEGISFCFDAEVCRFRFAWSGDFLNVKPTWADRGGQPPQILGTKFFIAPDIFPLRFGNSASEAKMKFLGYELINKLPEFRYEASGVVVRERLSVNRNPPALVRSFNLEKIKGDVWFSPGAGAAVVVGLKAISPDANGWCKVSGRQFDAVIPVKELPRRDAPKESRLQKASVGNALE